MISTGLLALHALQNPKKILHNYKTFPIIIFSDTFEFYVSSFEPKIHQEFFAIIENKNLFAKND